MKHTTLFCILGRASPRPICTVSDDAPDAAAQLAGAQAMEYAALVNGGNAPGRISFSQESEEIETSAPTRKRK
jgi:hypothetical protein